MKKLNKSTGEEVEVKVKHISALPGNPSTFWSADGGKTWYKYKSLAIKGNQPDAAVDPSDYIYVKGWLQKNKTALIIFTALALLAAGGFYLYHNGNLAFQFHMHKS